MTAEDDSEDDDGESITIGFGTLPTGVTAGSPDTTTVSLADDDGPAVTAVTVQFGAASYTATEGGTAATVEVTLSADPQRTVTIPLSVTAGGGAVEADYDVSVDAVTFDAGETSATFTVTANDDMVDDDDESITIAFGTLPTGVTATSPDTTTVSLTDNDDPAVTVQFGAAAYTATEGGTAATVAVTLSADPERTVTIPLSVTAAGGALPADYTLSQTSVTINAGDTSATFTVTAEDDSEDDDGESITIGFGTLPTGVTAGSRDTTTVSLVDDDVAAVTAVTVQFGAASYTATEGGTAATVEVTLSADPERTVTVPLTVTAVGGAVEADYDVSVDAVTFDAGETSATFTVTANDDMVDDDDESITIAFGTLPTGVTATSPDTTTVSLTDNDDPAVTVQFGAASYTATEDGTAATVEVTLSADPERTVDVPLEVTTAGGASSTDYTLSDTSLTFTSGQTTATFTVTAEDDSEDDDGESITIGFGTLPTGVTAGSRDTTTVSLVDDDVAAVTAVTVQFDAATYTATEGGTAATVEVTLSADPERTVTIPLTVTAMGGAVEADYDVSVDAVTFDAGETSATFTVTANDDMVDDDDESITIAFGTLPTGVTATSPDTTTVSLADNDDPAVTVQFGAASYTATEGGTAATVEVTLSADPERTVTIPLSVTTAGGASSTDYTLSHTSVTINAGDTSATFTVTAEDDSEDDDGESITIAFGTLPTGVSAGSTASTTVRLADDDGPALTAVTVRFDAATYTATEGGIAATVGLTLSADPLRTVTIPLSVTAAGGAVEADYELSEDAVTFVAGQTTATFTVTAVDDMVDDDGESIFIEFGVLPLGVTEAGQIATEVTLADNDAPDVTVQFGAASYTATEGGIAATVELTLSQDPQRTVTIPLSVTPEGGATTGDYTLSDTSVTFNAGDTSATVTVTAEDDIEDDDDESITIAFGTLPTGVTATSPDTTTVSLTDNDDPAVTVQFSSTAYTATEGGAAVTVELTLSADPERTVVVPLEVTAAGGALPADYTLSDTSVTFNAGELSASFTVLAVDDMVDDDDESITIGFGTLPTGVTATSPDTTTVSLADNDDPAVTVQFSSTAYTATEGGAAVTVEVVRCRRIPSAP